MATDDRQVRVTGTASAPAAKTIPGNGQIRPKSIFASYDGSGAAGDFIPAIKVISDGGEIVGIYPTESTVTAGGSVDVSWFPGVKPGGGGATSTTLAFARAYRDALGGAPDPVQNVNNGTNANGSFPHALTTAAAIMNWRTSSLQNDTLDLFALGTYLCWVTTHWDLKALGLSSILINAAQSGFPHTPWEPEKLPRFGDAIGSADNMDMNVLHVTVGGTSVHVSQSNNTANPQAVQQCYFTAVYLGTG